MSVQEYLGLGSVSNPVFHIQSDKDLHWVGGPTPGAIEVIPIGIMPEGVRTGWIHNVTVGGQFPNNALIGISFWKGPFTLAPPPIDANTSHFLYAFFFINNEYNIGNAADPTYEYNPSGNVWSVVPAGSPFGHDMKLPYISTDGQIWVGAQSIFADTTELVVKLDMEPAGRVARIT